MIDPRAVEAVARVAYEQDRAATKDPHRKKLPEWDGLNDAQRDIYRERLAPIVETAAPILQAAALLDAADGYENGDLCLDLTTTEVAFDLRELADELDQS